jgi:hypothetical protein
VIFVPYQRGDSSVPLELSNLQRSTAAIILDIDVTASSNELFCDGHAPLVRREVERCASILQLKIDVTASCNELLRDGRTPVFGRGVQRCCSLLAALVVDEGLRVWLRQQQTDRRFIASSCGIVKFLSPLHFV